MSFCLLSFCLLSFCLSVYWLSVYCLSVFLSFCLLSFCQSDVFLFTVFFSTVFQSFFSFHLPQCKCNVRVNFNSNVMKLFSPSCSRLFARKFIFSRKLGKISRRRLNSLLFTDIRFQMDKNAFNVYLWDLMHNKQICRSTFVKGLSYWNSSTFLRS